MTDETTRAVLRVVAATLRTAASWLTEDEIMLRDAAAGVDAFDPADDWCCPVCEEVLCDHGCPLDGIRKCDTPSAHQPDRRTRMTSGAAGWGEA